MVEAEPAAAAGPVRVMHFNICGSICNHGVIDRPGATDIIDDVRNRVRDFRPHILTLNEVCIAQFQRLKALFAGGSWKMRGAFRPQRDDSRCRNGTSYGDAVFSSAGVHGLKVLQLPIRRTARRTAPSSASGPASPAGPSSPARCTSSPRTR